MYTPGSQSPPLDTFAGYLLQSTKVFLGHLVVEVYRLKRFLSPQKKVYSSIPDEPVRLLPTTVRGGPKTSRPSPEILTPPSRSVNSHQGSRTTFGDTSFVHQEKVSTFRSRVSPPKLDTDFMYRRSHLQCFRVQSSC